MHHYYFPQCHTCQAPWHLRELARVLRDAGVQAIAVSHGVHDGWGGGCFRPVRRASGGLGGDLLDLISGC